MTPIKSALLGLSLCGVTATASPAAPVTVTFNITVTSAVTGGVTPGGSTFSDFVKTGDTGVFTFTYDDSLVGAFTGFANINPAGTVGDAPGTPSSSFIKLPASAMTFQVGNLVWGFDNFSGVPNEPGIEFLNGDAIDASFALTAPTIAPSLGKSFAEFEAALLLTEANAIEVSSYTSASNAVGSFNFDPNIDTSGGIVSAPRFSATYELEVAPIPLPAGVWLGIAGLGALGLIGRRRAI